MITTIADIKNRTMVESNTLKSYILSSTQNGGFTPELDDILIHDYQIANSITLNTILSNYVVNLRKSWKQYYSEFGGGGDSYFQITNQVQEDTLLPDTTKLLLDLDDGTASFKSRDISYVATECVVPEKTDRFINLDGLWYAITRDKSDIGMKEQIVLMNDELNDPLFNPNKFNMNPFGATFEEEGEPQNLLECDVLTGYTHTYKSLNDFLHVEHDKHPNDDLIVNDIVENQFYRSDVVSKKDKNGRDTDDCIDYNGNETILRVLQDCLYIVCLTNGMFGLKPKYKKNSDDTMAKDANGNLIFDGFYMYNLGKMIPGVLDESKYEFILCDFKSIEYQKTMFVFFKERETNVYYYTYFREDAYDKVYGLTEIKLLCTEGNTVDPRQVFNKIQYIRELDNINIVMTDYGFWDLEENNTGDHSYRYSGKKTYSPINTEYNDNHIQTTYRKDKIIHPTLKPSSSSKVVQYNKIWELNPDGNTYSCKLYSPISGKTKYSIAYNSSDILYDYDDQGLSDLDKSDVTGTVKYPKTILNGNEFVGAVDDLFAVYNSASSSSAYILVKMTMIQFKELLFANPNLLNKFMRWFYEDVIDSRQGELWIEKHHSGMVDTTNDLLHLTDGKLEEKYHELDYNLDSTDNIFNGKTKMYELVYPTETTDSNCMQKYCTALKTFLEDTNRDITKIISQGGVDSIKSQMLTKFRTYYGNESSTSGYLVDLVNNTLDGLLREYPNLGYFRDYLQEQMNKKLLLTNASDSTPSVAINSDTVSSFVGTVLGNLKDTLQSAMVLGGYDPSKSGNDRYPQLDSYLYQNSIRLNRTSVEDILSLTNTIDEVRRGVQSTPFFKDYVTYIQMNGAKDDEDLFKVRVNSNLIGQSGFINSDRLDIDWNLVKNWLFGSTITDENLLKAFIRTQIYRPLFFKYDNYVDFTNEYGLYRCETTKWYDDDGQKKQLFITKTSDDVYSVDLNASQFVGKTKDVNGVESEDIYQKVGYSILSNILSYEVHSDEIRIKNDKFVYDDTEFFCIRGNETIDGKNREVTSLYFNNHNAHIDDEVGSIQVSSSNQFELNGVRYILQRDEISHTYFSMFSDQFRTQIVDNRFELDGVQYRIVTQDGKTYVKHDSTEEYDLVKILVTNDGIAKFYNPDNSDDLKLQFKFKSPDVLIVVKYCFCQVKHKLEHEWCLFDDKLVDSITNDTSFDWYVANHIVELATKYPSYKLALERLGYGVVYNGFLDTDCTVDVQNEIVDGGVVSNCIVTFNRPNGDVKTNNIGVVYGYDMTLDQEKTIDGCILNGLVSTSLLSNKIIFNDVGSGRNNINCIWIDNTLWNNNVNIVKVGSCEIEFDGSISVTFDIEDERLPGSLYLCPHTENPSVFVEQDTGTQYQKQPNNTIHVISVGSDNKKYRYCINLATKEVSMLDFKPMLGKTIDYTSSISLLTLRNGLIDNIKNFVVTSSIQSILDNRKMGRINIVPTSDLNLFLDLFSDETSLQRYVSANLLAQDSTDIFKYQEVFKNNFVLLDESLAYDGKVYQSLVDLMNSKFGQNLYIPLVENTSIMAQRNSDGSDQYSYDVYFDLHLKANKDIISKSSNMAKFDDKYILGNVILKDLHGIVTFIPLYDSKNVGGQMKYSVTYSIQSNDNLSISYDQIIYMFEGKVKTKVIDVRTINGIKFDSVQPISYISETIGNITGEWISAKIDALFSEDKLKDLFLNINDNSGISTNELIEYRTTKQRWGLDTKEPSPVGGITPIEGSGHYGRVVIDGLLYDVEPNCTMNSLEDHSEGVVKDFTDDCQQIRSQKDNWLMAIQPLNAHNDIYDSSSSTDISKWDSTLSNEYACLGATIVKNSYLSNKFTFERDTNSVDAYLVYKESKFNPKFRTVRLSDVSYIYFEKDGEGTIGQLGKLNDDFLEIRQNDRNMDSLPTVSIGCQLEQDVPFLVSFTNEEIESGTATKTISGIKPQITEGEIDYYIPGSITMRFDNLGSDNVTSTIISGIDACQYSCQGYGDILVNHSVTKTTYILSEGQEVNNLEVIDGSDEDGNPTKQVSFTMSVKKDTSYIVSMPGTDERIQVSNWVVYGISATSSSIQVYNVCQVQDARGYSIGTLPYGIAYVPVNLDSASNFSELEFREVYFRLNGELIVSNGLHHPFNFEVLNPDSIPQRMNQIYDRYWESGSNITVEHQTIGSMPSISGKFVWMDKSSTLKSIHAIPTRNDYQTLCNNVLLPQMMKDKLTSQVLNNLRLQDSYFEMILTQLKTFLVTVDQQLKQTINKESIKQACNLKYDVTLKFARYSGDWNSATGLFSNASSSPQYASGLEKFNKHLYDEFFADYSQLTNTQFANGTAYQELLKSIVEKEDLLVDRNRRLKQVYGWVVANSTSSPELDDIFEEYSNSVKYINAVKTSINSRIDSMYVIDEQCYLFVDDGGDKKKWYSFSASNRQFNQIVDAKCVSGVNDYIFNPTIIQVKYNVGLSSDGWYFRCANRDMSITNTTEIIDSFILRCQDSQVESYKKDLWYVSPIKCYFYSPTQIQDMAYDQISNVLYVIFKGDNLIYKFNNPSSRMDYEDKVLLAKELSDMKIVNFHSLQIIDSQTKITNSLDYIYLDYDVHEEETSGNKTIRIETDLYLYGMTGNDYDLEHWLVSTKTIDKDLTKFDVVIVGDTLFNGSQLQFQNVSKNKDMFDILDINEVDGCYYGLFLNNTIDYHGQIVNSYESDSDPVCLDDNTKLSTYDIICTGQNKTYTIFKTANIDSDTSVVTRLPYQIAYPKIFKTADDLYSLYVIVRVPEEVQDNGNVKYSLKLQEVSVPDNELYVNRTIDIEGILRNDNIVEINEELNITDILIDGFKPGNYGSTFQVLSNKGLHRIGYVNSFKNLTIDSIADFNSKMTQSFRESILEEHLQKMHTSEDARAYFGAIKSKINQFDSNFSVFKLISTEFAATQDLGVIPNDKIDDVDTSADHRPDSVVVATDIVVGDGMIVDANTNPGLITCAVSNPETTYDNETVFMKSQRNPLLENTEFYDYIYDEEGNALMDLYEIPFVYRINSNNTYDLYINVPTTRTKYLNRIVGSLDDDLTSQVLADDSRTRRNFVDETMPNNLDESTTKLRVYIDRKYISIGNVEMVEISGNSIPLQIYRDIPNNGLYDSIALESRWNGELVDVSDSNKDINKVMLEFECYGTDSQSIHISGKTLIHYALDDNRYIFN